jgi:hypothetical protein
MPPFFSSSFFVFFFLESLCLQLAIKDWLLCNSAKAPALGRLLRGQRSRVPGEKTVKCEIAKALGFWCVTTPKSSP